MIHPCDDLDACPVRLGGGYLSPLARATEYNIAPEHLADAIERLVQRSQRSLSEDSAPAEPYLQARPDTPSATE